MIVTRGGKLINAKTMAHECIECGGDCYCGGDLDDCHTHYTPDDCTGCEETVIALIAMKRLMPWMGAVAEQMKSF